MIYEARPNVTADAAGLCIKTGNAVILRGGSLAHEQQPDADARARRGRRGSRACPARCIQAIESTEHAAAEELMGLHGYIDVLIPRGGAGLIRSVRRELQGPGHRDRHRQLPRLHPRVGRPGDGAADRRQRQVPAALRLQRRRVAAGRRGRLRERAARASSRSSSATASCSSPTRRPARSARSMRIEAATEDDWGTEYHDLKMSVKVVSGPRRGDRAHQHLRHQALRGDRHRATTRPLGASCTRSMPRPST